MYIFSRLYTFTVIHKRSVVGNQGPSRKGSRALCLKRWLKEPEFKDEASDCESDRLPCWAASLPQRRQPGRSRAATVTQGVSWSLPWPEGALCP